MTLKLKPVGARTIDFNGIENTEYWAIQKCVVCKKQTKSFDEARP
jgi:hypothetical protein